MLIGNSFWVKSKSNVRPILDVFFGLGLRYKTFEFETSNGTINDVYYSYKKEIGNSNSPGKITFAPPISIQFGAKMGFGVFK